MDPIVLAVCHIGCGGDDDGNDNDDIEDNRSYDENDEMLLTIMTDVNTAEVNAFPNPHLAIV